MWSRTGCIRNDCFLIKSYEYAWFVCNNFMLSDIHDLYSTTKRQIVVTLLHSRHTFSKSSIYDLYIYIRSSIYLLYILEINQIHSPWDSVTTPSDLLLIVEMSLLLHLLSIACLTKRKKKPQYICIIYQFCVHFFAGILSSAECNGGRYELNI